MGFIASFLRRRERELDRELRFHVEEETAANVARGMNPQEARRQAMLSFGGLEQIKEDCRDQRSMVWLEQTTQDFRYACRQIVKAPGFAAIAIVTLALGIGATTAIFSVVNSVLFKPLAYKDSERLVNVRETQMPRTPILPVNPANFRDLSQASRDVFESLYAERPGPMNLTGNGDPIRVSTDFATFGIFHTLGVEPLIGRVLQPEDEKPGNNHVVVLNHGFWLRQFGGHAEVLGTTIHLNDEPYTVVGILPPEFGRAFTKDLVTPLVLSDQGWADRRSHSLSVFARLKPNVTVAQAQTKLAFIAAQLAQQYPDTNRGTGIGVVSILENRTASTRGFLFTILGAVSLLLLIACTNVANLLLARATAREREISVRAALGASRTRLVRQMLVESLVLALAGAIIGLGVAKVGLALLLAYAPPTLPRQNLEIVLDLRAVLVTIAIAVLTGLAFGLVPALQGTRIDLSRAMKQGGRGGSGPGNRTRNGLVIGAVALAVMLLTGAGLLMRSFAEIAQFDSGFNPHGVLIVTVITSEKSYNTAEKKIAFADAVIERYRAMSGGLAVAASQALPITGADFRASIQVAGHPVPANEAPVTDHFAVTPDYFQVLGIRLVRGRLFTSRDRLGGSAVALLSESSAKQLFPATDPIGQQVAFATEPQLWREVVGIVSDVRPYDVEHEPLPQSYVPLAQAPFPYVNVFLRPTAAPPTAEALRREIYAVDPKQPIARVFPFDQLIMGVFGRQRFAMMLFIVFSVIALFLAMIGIYGVMAFSVSRRTAEFGVRIAMGAQSRDVMRLILGQAGRLVLSGIVVGVAAALGAGRFIQSMLYHTPAYDPWVLGAIALLLVVAALVAAFVPARRATKVDPLVALRAE
jgi:predicted permease